MNASVERKISPNAQVLESLLGNLIAWAILCLDLPIEEVRNVFRRIASEEAVWRTIVNQGEALRRSRVAAEVEYERQKAVETVTRPSKPPTGGAS